MPVPKSIIELVERFDDNLESYKQGKYKEARLRREFIDPFFEELGWDIANKKGYAEAYKEVVHEDAIKIGKATKAPDYCFRIGGFRKFFLEAKKPFVDIKHDTHPAYQLRRYAWSAKLPLSILTDFEEFAVYDCRVRPTKKDKASHSRVLYCRYSDYIEKWDEINSIFSFEAINKGAFDKFVASTKVKKGTTEVDVAFLQEIERWREMLARNIALRNPDLSQRDLNFAVQRTIDRIIFLRICEDRGIEKYGNLNKLLANDGIYTHLFKIFQRADDLYNSGLFHFKPEKGRTENVDTLTPGLSVDDKILKDIIKNLYYPDSPYEFSVLPADILGQVYEQFLGKIIRLTISHRAKIEFKPEVKKAGGVYYTPTHVVNYIVRQTVGKLLKGKKPGPRGSANKLKILDPACGSGSFLLGAYQYLLDWYLDEYVKDNPKKWSKGKKPRIYKGPNSDWRLTTDERKRILLNNIYGVDIDSQAVEVTKLSLLLKVLEGENQQTIHQQLSLFRERALPDLIDNIKCGNSLISPDFYEKKQMDLFDEEKLYRINVFDWHIEFPEIMKNGGFDAVIGNPPWGATLLQDEKQYLSNKYNGFLGNFDSYLFFIEKTIQVAKDRTLLSFITPDTWIRVPQAQNLRDLVLEKNSVELITILPSKIFKKVSANCIVYVIGKGHKTKNCRINILLPDSDLAKLDNEQFDDSYNVKISYWKKSSDSQFQIYQRNEVAELINRINAKCIPAVNFLDVMQGIVPYSRENHSDEIVENRLFHFPKKKSKEYGPWVQGRSVSRYNLLIGKEEYLKYGDWLHRPRKEKYFNSPRILIQEITGGKPPRISACYYETTLYHDPGIISALNIGDTHTFYLLGIINSLLLSWYHRFSSPKGFRQAFPKVLIGDIRKLPIPKIYLDNKVEKSNHDKMVRLVTQMIDLHKQLNRSKMPHAKTTIQRQIDATDRQIDKLVYKLYNLTENEIEIVESSTAQK